LARGFRPSPSLVLLGAARPSCLTWGKINFSRLSTEAKRDRTRRAAAAIARTVVVFVIDKKEESPAEEKLYFIFVARGYARTLKPAILFELVPGFKMLGHVGWITARVLTWKHAAAHVISATFMSTTMRSSGMPIRSYTNKPIPVFNYKPVLVVASSGILK